MREDSSKKNISYEDFEALLQPFYAEIEANPGVDHVDPDDVLPYLDTKKSSIGVSISALDATSNLFYKSLACFTRANKFEGAKTRKTYFKYCACSKWWCEQCGKKRGKIHKRRIQKVREKINEDLKGTVLRQIVFTIPKDAEIDFMSRAALNSLARNPERIIKQFFPGLKCLIAIQLFGDRGVLRYRPHAHVLIWEKKGCKLILSQEMLSAINEKWRRSLQGFLRRPVSVVDTHVSFVTDPRKINHRIRYVTRPCPGYEHFEEMTDDVALLNFCMNTLHGFVFIRYFNGCKRGKIHDESLTDEKKEYEGLAGEKLRFIPGGQISRIMFDMLYQPSDYTELSPGFYRIN
jgi:hypothetical protein